MLSKFSYILGIFISLFLHGTVGYAVYYFSNSLDVGLFESDGPRYIRTTVVSIDDLDKRNFTIFDEPEEPAKQVTKKNNSSNNKNNTPTRKGDNKNKADENRNIRRGGNTKQDTNTTDTDTSLKSGRGVETTTTDAGQKEGDDSIKDNTDESSGVQEETKTQEEIEQEQRVVRSRISAYTKRINQALIENWSRPSNVEINDNVLVELQLLLNPDGTVQDVSVLTSSGNELFDRSALAAVKKITKFAVPNDKKLFDDYFKEVILQFKNPQI